MTKKIFIKTFGCQMNEYDSNRIYDTVKKIDFGYGTINPKLWGIKSKPDKKRK